MHIALGGVKGCSNDRAHYLELVVFIGFFFHPKTNWIMFFFSPANSLSFVFKRPGSLTFLVISIFTFFFYYYYLFLCIELSWKNQGYELLYRWASKVEWIHKASNQVLATCSPNNMPLQQICVVPARETASNGRSSMGKTKEKNKEVEVSKESFFFRTDAAHCSMPALNSRLWLFSIQNV